MSGIFEQLLAAIQANTDAINRVAGAPAPPVNPAQPSPALTSPPAPPAVNVSSEQLTSLIMPHIGNPAVKEALGVAMRSIGVAALPEAQPHQYGALFTAFQNVLAQFGLAGQGNPTPQPASII